MITFEHPYFYQDDAPFIPEIFDAGRGEAVPAGFNAVRIPLDGGLYSDLKWDDTFHYAHALAAQGLKLLWDLDLGLFSRLRFPLSDQVQFQSLALAVQHLLNSIRRDFLGSTLGVVLYRGSLDFRAGFPWDVDSRAESAGSAEHAIQRRCRDLCLHYLHQLRVGWPDAVQPFLVFDAARIRSPLQQMLLMQRDRMSHFVLTVSGGRFSARTLGWECGSPYGYLSRKRLPIETTAEVKLGVCIPTLDLSEEQVFESTVQALIMAQTPFRVLTEEFLTVEWDGLDTILLPTAGLGATGMRKLQGFLAAGGEVKLATADLSKDISL